MQKAKFAKYLGRKMNKAGQTIGLATGTIVSLIIMIFIVFACLFGVAILNPPSFFPRGAGTLNVTNDAVQALQDNTTQVIGNFSQRLPVLGTILGVVLLLSVIGILVVVIIGFAQRSKGAIGGGGSI